MLIEKRLACCVRVSVRGLPMFLAHGQSLGGYVCAHTVLGQILSWIRNIIYLHSNRSKHDTVQIIYDLTLNHPIKSVSGCLTFQICSPLTIYHLPTPLPTSKDSSVRICPIFKQVCVRVGHLARAARSLPRACKLQWVDI